LATHNNEEHPLTAETKHYLAQFVDIHGRAKAKLVPAAHKELIYTVGAGFAGFAIEGVGIGPHGAEFMAVGDRTTERALSWMPGVVNVTCEGHVDGKPHSMDSRVIARKALDAFKAETGTTFMTGMEPEFFLLKKQDDGQYKVATESESLNKPCYDFRLLSSVAPVLSELQAALNAVGIDVYQIDHEDANGQFEMNFTYADALKTCDNLSFFRMAAGGIAKQHGMLCSFMPKPFAERSGNGLHVHMSAADASGSNSFEDANDAQGLGLSQTAYHFLGGLMEHAAALTAIAAPCVNSYKRLVVRGSRSGATWAPVNVAYGNNNRTAFVRAPGGRLELRVPDASANPYLLTAAVVYAGLDGIRKKTNPGPACNQNLYQLSGVELAQRGIRRLPSSLLSAVDALEANAVLREGLGADFVQVFCELKRQEADEMAAVISAEEFKRYVDFY
jgi:glutamine synthetase